LLLISTLLPAESLEDAVRALVKKVAAGLAPAEVAHVTPRNLSSMSAADAAKAQTLFDRGLRKRVRTPVTIEVGFTVSENLRGYLLIAEIHRENSRAVEMETFQPDPPQPPSAPGGVRIEKRLIWEQDAPILDVAIAGNTMLVLDTQGIAKYERRSGTWERGAASAIALPPLRDPRGRLEWSGDSVVAWLPSGTCRGTLDGGELRCEAANAEFTIDGRSVRFTPGGNTLEGAVDDAVASCGGALTPGDAGRDAADTLTVMESGRAAGEAVQLPGPVTALWPAPGGALAVARNLATGRYAAYTLAIDCGR
jgi:hypothetical protein